MNPAAPVTLSKAIAEEPRLQAARDAEPVVRRAFDIALKLEGLHRHASTHAAGIVIGDRPLSELVPMYRDPKSDMPVTQFNMKWVEQRGAGEVRLPRPEDAQRAGHRGEAASRGAASSSICWRFRSTMPRATRCWRAARRSASSRWKGRGCAARSSTCGRTASRTSSRWSRSIVRARWRTSRPIARASTARSSPNTSTPSSSRCCARPSGSSSIRSR